MADTTSNSKAKHPFGANAASAIMESRDKEKKQMRALNDRLSAYIERVRFLEEQNKDLAQKLEEIRGTLGKDSDEVKQAFAPQVQQARQFVDDDAKDRADKNVKIARLQDEIAEIRKDYDDTAKLRKGDKDKIDGFNREQQRYNDDLAMLKKRFQNLQDEYDRYKKDNDRLEKEVQKARDAANKGTVDRMGHENKVQSLMEELDLLQRLHDTESEEVGGWVNPNNPEDNRNFFKNELALAIEDIKKEYDQIANQNKDDMQKWYDLKVKEVELNAERNKDNNGKMPKDDVERLRDQLKNAKGKLTDEDNKNKVLENKLRDLKYKNDDNQRGHEKGLNDKDNELRRLRDEAQALMTELQALLNTKQSLDAEIAIYQKILERGEKDGPKST